MNSKPVRVALVQRLVPHYNLVFYKKLLKSSQHSWEFIYGQHLGGGESGLTTDAAKVLPSRPLTNVALGSAVWQRGVAGWLRKQRYDAVIFEVGWQIVSNPWLVYTAHRVGSVVIPWAKGIAESGRPRPAWRRFLEKAFIHRCDALLVYGNVSADYFSAYGYPRDRIFIAQNTVDVRWIAAGVPGDRIAAVALRERLGLSGRLVLGYFGRLVPQKRVDAIIEAYVSARSQGLQATLVIAGDGPDRERLQALARRTIVAADIVFVGRVSEAEAGAYFQMFDVFVSAFSAGLGVLEAMAHGKTVLITPEVRPETEFVRHGATGIVAPGYDITDITLSLHEAARTVQAGNLLGEEGQRAVLAGAAQEHMVEMFDLAVLSALKKKTQL